MLYAALRDCLLLVFQEGCPTIQENYFCTSLKVIMSFVHVENNSSTFPQAGLVEIYRVQNSRHYSEFNALQG